MPNTWAVENENAIWDAADSARVTENNIEMSLQFIQALKSLVDCAQNDFVRENLMPAENTSMMFFVAAYRNIAVMEKRLA